MSASERRVVISGLGVVSPIGIGLQAFWDALIHRRSGVAPVAAFPIAGLPFHFAGEVRNFDPKRYVKQRKSLRVMARDIQLAVSAAQMAVDDAGLEAAAVPPCRLGVEFGAGLMCTDLDELGKPVEISTNGTGSFDYTKWGEQGLPEIPPLWMLKYLPNMIACHVSIFYDAQGPNNTITAAEAASNLALGEALRVIQRGDADVMITGGADSKMHPLSLVRQALLNPMSRRNEAPERACRPFDLNRDGLVTGEGAAVLVLEELEHARRRGAPIYAELIGMGAGCDARPTDDLDPEGRGAAIALAGALRDARINPDAIGHINAHGLSTPVADVAESRAIHQVFGAAATRVPVTAPKSYFGNLAAGAGAVELVASVLAVKHGVVPPTLNYDDLDPECPLRIIAGDPQETRVRSAVSLNFTRAGQAAALVIRALG